MKYAALSFFLVLMSSAFSQSFDGKNVSWDFPGPVQIQASAATTIVYSKTGFALENFEDSILFQALPNSGGELWAIDTTLLAPWLVPGSGAGRDGVYNLYGVWTGSGIDIFQIPGIYILVSRGKSVLVYKPN